MNGVIVEISEVFVGREKEIAEFYRFLDKDDCPVFVVIGEPGIGKSTFLKEITKRIQEGSKGKIFVGFHSVIYRTDNVASPFVRTLDDLMESLSASLRERIKEGAKRALRVGEKIFSEKGRKIARSLFKAFAVKWLDKETLEELEKAVKEWKETPSIFSFVEEKISKYREDFVYDFCFTLRTLVDEYKELKFVLVIDQFERVSPLSCEMLLGIVRMKPRGIHIAVSFKIEKDGTTSFESIKSDLLQLHAKTLELPTLSEEQIGEWISKVKGKEFSRPELRKIKRLSGGFPLVIFDWLKMPRDLSPNTLRVGRKKYCELIKWRFDQLSKDCSNFLRNMCVLTEPLSINDYAKLTSLKVQESISLLEELERNWIFTRVDDTYWFRHELIKPCLENKLLAIEKRHYHKVAANFFEETLSSQFESGARVKFFIVIGCAYHFHHAGNYKKSREFNPMVGNLCSDMGLWDVAEECYLRAIEAAMRLDDDYLEMVARGNLANIYEVWGKIEDAYKAHLKVLQYFRKKKNKPEIATALNNVATIEQRRGNYDEAKKLYEESIEIMRELGDRFGIAETLHNLALIEQARKNYDEARKTFEQNLEIFEELGNMEKIAMTFGALGTLLRETGHPEEATKHFLKAAKIFHQLGVVEKETAIDDIIVTIAKIDKEKIQKILQKIPEEIQKEMLTRLKRLEKEQQN